MNQRKQSKRIIHEICLLNESLMLKNYQNQIQLAEQESKKLGKPKFAQKTKNNSKGSKPDQNSASQKEESKFK